MPIFVCVVCCGVLWFKQKSVFLFAQGCSRTKGVGMERNLKMGVLPTQFYLFYGTVHMDVPGNTPTHLILIDFIFTPPPMPFFLEQPSALF